MKAKKAIIRKSVFSTPLPHLKQSLPMFSDVAYNQISQKGVSEVLMTQVTTKASRPDKINFKILQLILDWDKV